MLWLRLDYLHFNTKDMNKLISPTYVETNRSNQFSLFFFSGTYYPISCPEIVWRQDQHGSGNPRMVHQCVGSWQLWLRLRQHCSGARVDLLDDDTEFGHIGANIGRHRTQAWHLVPGHMDWQVLVTHVSTILYIFTWSLIPFPHKLISTRIFS